MTKTTTTKKVPELRFPEFEGDWEVIKLADHADFFKGKGISKKDIVDNGINHCIRYGELYTIYKEIIFKKYIISKTNTPKESSVLSRKNDVIIPSSGETQLDIATASCIQDDDIILGGDLNIIRSKINGAFLAYYLNNKKKKQIAQLAQGNSVVHLYNRNISTLNLNIPSKNEQQKIANFLTQVDKKIELLEKKQAALEQYKKGVMQKIFNREIRFPIENEAGERIQPPEWEEKKLGEVVKVQGGFAFQSKNFIEDGIPVIRISNIKNDGKVLLDDVKYYANIKQNKFEIKKGDLLIAMSGATTGKSGVYKYDSISYLNQRVGLFKTKNEELFYEFLVQLVLSKKFEMDLSKLLVAGAQPNLSNIDIESMFIKLPSLKEQTKIANFLSALDQKIEAVAERSRSHREWKKGLLQKMFV